MPKHIAAAREKFDQYDQVSNIIIKICEGTIDSVF